MTMSDDSSRSADVINKLLSSNRQWIREMNAFDPCFFPKSAEGQYPKILWIGCSDSRVPESVITASLPGEIFTHRNIANQFPVDDVNAGAVLEYSVGHLPIVHIIIAGHTHCGGAQAALKAARTGPRPPATGTPVEKWLAALTQRVIDMNIDPNLPEDKAVQLVIEENIRMQVENIGKTEIIRKARSEGRAIYIHSWLYHIESGYIEYLQPHRPEPTPQHRCLD